MNLTFHGAAQEVTGSMHLVEVDGLLIALDCGLFQGRRSESQEKNGRFPVAPSRLHAVILSHAHIDHCGRLPLLVKRGFLGPIYSSPATRDLAALLLSDSAHIQFEDARFLNKKRARRGEPPLEPLYTADDAADAIRQFRAVSEGQPFYVSKRVRVRFHQAGHMLGSCMMELEFTPPDGQRPQRLVFTGDVGRFNTAILQDPQPIPPCDYLICESTYGGRRHPSTDGLREQFAEVVRDAVARGGKIIIPAFSVGRTQMVVFLLNQLQREGRIPSLPVFVDSPMAVSATEIYRLHPELFDSEARKFLLETGDILGSEGCTYIRDPEESKKLNRRRAPCVIISASGMCETGRIVHHLRNNIGSPRNTILIVGFQAAHTLGRRLVERQPHVEIFGEKHKVRAQVVALNGFSGHADRDELDGLLRPIAAGCRRAFLVHGEPDQMAPLRETMLQHGFARVETPATGETFSLNGAAVPDGGPRR